MCLPLILIGVIVGIIFGLNPHSFVGNDGGGSVSSDVLRNDADERNLTSGWFISGEEFQADLSLPSC